MKRRAVPGPNFTKSDILAVRRLDIEWAHKSMEEASGAPYHAARSEVTGVWMTADEVALMSLHKMRSEIGSKKEAKESRDWLRERGLKGLWEMPLDLN